MSVWLCECVCGGGGGGTGEKGRGEGGDEMWRLGDTPL